MERYITWEAYEHEPRERRSDWFWAVGIITLAVAVTSILFQNILLAVFIILGAFSLMLLASRKQELVQFSITDAGIQVGKVLYVYPSLEGFWIDETVPKRPQLLVKSKKVLMPLLVIPLGEVDPDTVSPYLLRHIPKEELHEPLVQKIVEYLGF